MTPTAYQSLASVSGLVGGLLRRHVRRRPDRGPLVGAVGVAAGVELADQAEVEQHDPAGAVDQDVRRLEIAVELARDVEREDAVDELGQRARPGALVEPGARDVLARRAAVGRDDGRVSSSTCGATAEPTTDGRTQSMNDPPSTSSIVKNHSSPWVWSSCRATRLGWTMSARARNSRLKR